MKKFIKLLTCAFVALICIVPSVSATVETAESQFIEYFEQIYVPQEGYGVEILNENGENVINEFYNDTFEFYLNEEFDAIVEYFNSNKFVIHNYKITNKNVRGSIRTVDESWGISASNFDPTPSSGVVQPLIVRISGSYEYLSSYSFKNVNVACTFPTKASGVSASCSLSSKNMSNYIKFTASVDATYKGGSFSDEFTTY